MRVLVSGAGVAGPTLAWFLAKTRAQITILEKAPSILPHGQNVDIQGSAVSVVRKMGLLDEIRKYNTTEKGTRLINGEGKSFAHLPVKENAGASFTSEFEILRADLAGIFYRATKDQPNIKYVFDTTIHNVISNEDDSVKVQLSNGSVETYDLLVAADGQWSKVRKQCFPAESIKVRHMGMYSVYYTVPRQSGDNEWWNIYFTSRARNITTRPDPHGTTRVMFTIMPSGETQEGEWRDAARQGKKSQGELLRREFSDAGWQAQRFLHEIDQSPDFYFHVIQQIRMDKWFNKCVVCLGDAGYAPAPLTGMGTSLAILGGYLLAGEITKLQEGDSVTKALEAYDKQFHPFVEKVQDVPWWVPGIGHPDTKFKLWMLQTGICVLAKVLSFPWITSHMSNPAETVDFPLPEYPVLEGEKSG